MELIPQYTFILVYRLFIHIPFKSSSSCLHQTKKVSSYSATTPQVYVLSTFDMGFKEKTLCILLLFASGCLGIGMSSGQTIIGIDLGMPYSSVGVYRNGKVEIIENEQGNRITPSCVAFTDREVLIGEAAKNQSHLNAERTICDFKRLIGRKFHNPEVQRVQSISPYKIVDKDGKPYVEVKRNGETSVFSPEEIAAMVLRKMKDMAEAYLGEEIKKAVVTVPGSTYYNANDNKQRTAIRDACEMVGIDVPRLLAEPYAALIAYGLHEELDKNVLVLDIRTSRSEIFVLNKDFWSGISSQSSDRNFGGQDFDYRLMDYFVKLIKKKHEKDVSQDKEALGKLLRECERVRVELSHKGYAARVEVKLLFDGVDFSERLTLETFEELNIDLLKRVLVLVKKALEGANLKKLDIHEIVFVGGGTRVPKLKQLVKDFFLGKKPLDDINVDEVVAYGAAIKGADLGEDKIKDILLLEMIPVSMGIETVGGVMTKVVPRDTMMPARKLITLTTYQDHQTSLPIKIYGGERAFAKDCREIVSFNLSDIAPAPRGVPQIEVKFLMQGDEKVHVTARDMASGNSKSITLLMPFNASRVMRCLIKKAETFEEEDKKMVERIEARKKLERFFKIGSSSINNCNADVFTSEIVDEENAKHASKDVLGWLYELDKKVNDWEALVRPVMRKSCEIIVGRDPDDYEETTHDEL